MSKPQFEAFEPGEVTPAEFDQVQMEAISAIRRSKGFVLMTLHIEDAEVNLEAVTGFFFAEYQSTLNAILVYFQEHYAVFSIKIMQGIEEFIERNQ